MSLGNCVFTKSIDWAVWRMLAPPRDALPSCQYATLKSAPQPRRFYLTQPLAKPGPRPQFDGLAVADIVHGETPTTEPVPREELHSPQQSYQSANVVTWANTLHDFDLRDDLKIPRYSKGDKTIARRVASEVRSQIHKIDKALAVEYLQGINPGLQEIQWHRSLRLLIAHTKIKENRLPEDDLDEGYERRGKRRRRRNQFPQTAADRVPRPFTWSTENFKEYVSSLVGSSVTGPLHRQLYDAGDSHRSSVMRILHQLFNDPQLNAYISIAACNTALAYFYRMSRFADSRSILSLMEDRGLLTSTETFNIILRGSAHLKNVGNFEYILKQMIERGIKPDVRTWMVFYRISDSDQARSEIYHSMREKGVLQHPGAMRDFLIVTIRDVLIRHFEKGRSIASLLEHLNGLDTDLWLSADFANVILDEIAKRSPMQGVIKVLKQLERLGMGFDEVTLNTLLHHCSPNRNHDEAIEILRCFRERYGLLPGRLAYDTLFRQVWYHRLYNCSKVIWTYACSEGFVTYRMKRRVANSLLRDLPADHDAQPISRGEMWRAAGGKFVVGLSLLVKSHAAFHRPSSSASLLSRKEPTTPERSDHDRRIHNEWTDCFSQDAALAYRVHIHEHLDVLLRRALALDRQWALEDVSTQNSFEWMLRHSIRVELKKNFAAKFSSSNRTDQALKNYLEEQHPLNFQGSEDSEEYYSPCELYESSELYEASQLYEAPERYEPSSEFHKELELDEEPERYESLSEFYRELELNEESELSEASELYEESELNEASDLHEASKPEGNEQVRSPSQEFSSPKIHLAYTDNPSV